MCALLTHKVFYSVSFRFPSCKGLWEHFQDWFESSSFFLFIKSSIWLHVVVVPWRGVMTWMPSEFGSLFRTVTYLLVSIFRFHMLACVSKAAARLKFPPEGKCNLTVAEVWWYLQQMETWCKLWRKLLFCKYPCWFDIFMLQFVKNEADHHGRSSRSPVMLFDIQDNNNVNSFAVRCCRVLLE